jgi:hypothetical protein
MGLQLPVDRLKGGRGGIATAVFVKIFLDFQSSFSGVNTK